MEQKSVDVREPPSCVPSPIPAFALSGVFSPLVLALPVVVALVALFGPRNIVEQWSLASAFTESMRDTFPFIDRHAASSVYPQLALLVDCLFVGLTPVAALVWVGIWFLNYPRLLAWNKAVRGVSAKTHLFIITLGIPFCLCSIYFEVGLPGDPSWANGFTTHSRTGLALMSALGLWLESMALGSWVPMTLLFLDLHLRNGSAN